MSQYSSSQQPPGAFERVKLWWKISHSDESQRFVLMINAIANSDLGVIEAISKSNPEFIKSNAKEFLNRVEKKQSVATAKAIISGIVEDKKYLSQLMEMAIEENHYCSVYALLQVEGFSRLKGAGKFLKLIGIEGSMQSMRAFEQTSKQLVLEKMITLAEAVKAGSNEFAFHLIDEGLLNEKTDGTNFSQYRSKLPAVSLMRGFNVQQLDRNDFLPAYHLLVVAVLNGRVRMVEKILESGCELDVQTLHLALKTATRNENSTVYQMLVKAGADINYNEGEILSDAIRDRQFSRIIFLLQEGVVLTAGHRQLVKSLMTGRNDDDYQKLSSLFEVIDPVFNPDPALPALSFAPAKPIKSDAIQKNVQWSNQPFIGISSYAAITGAVFADFNKELSDRYLQTLLKEDIERVEQTKGLSYSRYLSAIKEQTLPIIDFKDVLKEVAEVIILPILIRDFYAKNSTMPKTAFGHSPNVVSLESLTEEAFQIASSLILKDKTTLDVLVLNAKWHRAGNRCPDVIRPYSIIAEWHPLFNEAVDVGDNISVVCLHTAEQLKSEGSELSHCVGGYSSACQSGMTQILSMKQNGTSIATIELAAGGGDVCFPDGSEWSIRQFRGFSNLKPSDRMEKWLERFKFLVREGRVEENSQAGKTATHNKFYQTLSAIEQRLGFELSNSNQVREECLAHYQERVQVERSGKKVTLLGSEAVIELQKIIEEREGQADQMLFPRERV